MPVSGGWKRSGAAAAAAVLFSLCGIALALGAPFFQAAIVADDLVVSTVQLPKGWFWHQNRLDPSATTLRLDWSFDATGCSPAAAGGTLQNASTGADLTAALNNPGNVVGWFWSASVDLSSGRNSFFEQVQCDGTVDIVGCDEAVPVNAQVSAWDKNGACRTDDDGGCLVDTLQISLPPVQLATVVITDCGGACVGPCVSACTQECNAYPEPQLLLCKRACPFTCQAACEVGQFK